MILDLCEMLHCLTYAGRLPVKGATHLLEVESVRLKGPLRWAHTLVVAPPAEGPYVVK